MTARRPVHRVKGRGALVRRLGSLYLATARFARARASSEDERRWAGKVLDALDAALVAAGVSRSNGSRS
jgi:hypothetical protein